MYCVQCSQLDRVTAFQSHKHYFRQSVFCINGFCLPYSAKWKNNVEHTVTGDGEKLKKERKKLLNVLQEENCGTHTECEGTKLHKSFLTPPVGAHTLTDLYSHPLIDDWQMQHALITSVLKSLSSFHTIKEHLALCELQLR